MNTTYLSSMIKFRKDSYNLGRKTAKAQLLACQHPQIMQVQPGNRGPSAAYVSGYNVVMRQALNISTRAKFIAGWDSFTPFQPHPKHWAGAYHGKA